MPWIKPDFEEISLCMEVTAYVNTEEKAGERAERPAAETGVRTERDGE